VAKETAKKAADKPVRTTARAKKAG
jgi:hypothetical protein